MTQYAKNTNVSSELSKIEIEKILIKYGAENFAYATAVEKALIGFTMFGRQVKFILPLPKKRITGIHRQGEEERKTANMKHGSRHADSGGAL